MLPENINLSELPSVYLLDKERLPNCAAIYFVGDSQGQIIYIGKTVNLLEKWKDHHRFNQLRRFNRKNKLSICWLTCKPELEILAHLENEFIQLYKPPLNWSQVVAPIKKITSAETILQQSLQQLAKLKVMILGFDPIPDNEPPTIYLLYPVYGMRGFLDNLKKALKNSNKKASSLKWTEYQTERKSSGKFGYWETKYNGLKIDLSPAPGLVEFMQDSNRQTLAGVELMAFSSEQLEILLEKMSEYEEKTSSLGALEDDPIPVEIVDENQVKNGKDKDIVQLESWEELEAMAEGQLRVMNRQFVYVDDVEIEVCENENGKHFVRHNVYWWIMHRRKNPDPVHNCIILNFQNAVDKLPTIRWSGYKFKFETIRFIEDDVEVDSVLLPLAMFEDLMKDTTRFNHQFLEKIIKGEYKPNSHDRESIKLFLWLQSNSISSLIQTKK